MSIGGDLQQAIASGELMPLPMRLETDPQNRVMLLSKEIQGLVLGPYLTTAHEVRAHRLWADLESFVRGENVSMSLTPMKAKAAAFGLLNPVGSATFDFRSRDPSPSLRMLGHFHAADCFVALTWWPKRINVDWSPKEPLGDDPLKWRLAMHECGRHWFKLLPNSVPISGLKGEKYVSSKLFIVRP